MRLVAISLVVLLVAPGLRAEPATADSAARRQLADRGARKIMIGVALLTAGVFAFPLTSEGAARLHTPAAAGRFVGLGLVGVGMGFTLSGVRDRERSVKPSVTFSGALGSRKIIRISRSW